MPNRKHWVSIIVAPHDQSDSRQIRVPGWTLWAFAGFCVMGLLGLVALGLLYGDYQKKTAVVEHMKAENRSLMEAGRRLAELEEELATLGNLTASVREWVGLPPDTVLFAVPTPAFGNAGVTGSQESGGALVSDWVWPARGWISRGFHSAAGGDPGHLGIDVVAGKDEPVCASRSGVVTRCGWDDRFGNLVIVEHEGGYTSFYGHNAELLVEEGDTVSSGQQIAIIGSTGVSSAPHLHFEIRKGGEVIDPMTLLVEE